MVCQFPLCVNSRRLIATTYHRSGYQTQLRENRQPWLAGWEWAFYYQLFVVNGYG
jgi:hypothetical protein